MISNFFKSKRRGISPEVGSTKYLPVMFDMDPFGGKKVPCTKYQESGTPSEIGGPNDRCPDLLRSTLQTAAVGLTGNAVSKNFRPHLSDFLIFLTQQKPRNLTRSWVHKV